MFVKHHAVVLKHTSRLFQSLFRGGRDSLWNVFVVSPPVDPSQPTLRHPAVLGRQYFVLWESEAVGGARKTGAVPGVQPAASGKCWGDTEDVLAPAGMSG